jgi:glycosyltransferase involved in cell wall biosynthesis
VVFRCLDDKYSTTRLVTDTPPAFITRLADNSYNNALQCRRGNVNEGGLRTKGIYKNSAIGKPLITIITVVLNGASTLRDTIESVLRQTYDNLEYIVVDGGSDDGVIELLKQYGHAIDYWVSEKDNGIYEAMNKGIALSSGAYVGMMNADDLFASDDAVQAVADRFLSTNTDAIFSKLDIVDRENVAKIIRKYRVDKLSPWLLRIGVMPPHPTFYCKRACFESAGLYKTDYSIAADFEMLVRLCIKEKISWEFIDKGTVLMRRGGVSSSGLSARFRLNREIIRACRANGLYTNALLLALKLPLRLFELIR